MVESDLNSNILTQAQREALYDLIGRGFIQIRILGWGGQSNQAADLADALHSLPYEIHHKDFSWDRLKSNLRTYHWRYPPHKKGNYFDFLTLAEQIQNNSFEKIN